MGGWGLGGVPLNHAFLTILGIVINLTEVGHILKN